jgi:hypothetical protein
VSWTTKRVYFIVTLFLPMSSLEPTLMPRFASIEVQLHEIAGDPFHDNFVTLAKYSCHFWKLPTDDVIVVARADKSPIGQVDFCLHFIVRLACFL